MTTATAEEKTTAVFAIHKPGQAKASRNVAFLGGLALLVWGCRSLLLVLPAEVWRRLGDAWNEILMDAAPSAAWRVDLVVLESKFSPALTIAALVILVGGLLWFRAVNGERLGDLLIDMEGELRKVSWPTFPDAWQSTLVVSGFTALVVVLVFFYDFVIKHFVDLMPKGGL